LDFHTRNHRKIADLILAGPINNNEHTGDFSTLRSDEIRQLEQGATRCDDILNE
jgi:hypothetical protein